MLAKGLTVAAAGLAMLVAIGAALAETVDGRRVVIIDGDTIALGRERLRIENIDAPESFRPRCEPELVKGLKAKERLRQLLQVGPIAVERRGTDRYGRTLSLLSVNGLDVGEILVREGHALSWRDGAKAHDERAAFWCGKALKSSV